MFTEKLIRSFLVFAVLILFSGCAHYVEFKSPDTYQYSSVVPFKAAFYMDKNLKDKMYSGRAWSSGIANSWDVPVGQVVREYAAAYLKTGFADFAEVDSPNKTVGDILIKVTDINYYMEGQASHSDVTFVIENLSGKQVFNKTYHADGPSGYGRVIAGGAFAQKSAIRQSTHVVMENIFKNLMEDIQNNYKKW